MIGGVSESLNRSVCGNITVEAISTSFIELVVPVSHFCCCRVAEEISLDYEFRAFVYDGRITAISQYDHYAHYPHLEAEKHVILAAINTMWQEVHRRLQMRRQAAYLSGFDP